MFVHVGVWVCGCVGVWVCVHGCMGVRPCVCACMCVQAIVCECICWVRVSAPVPVFGAQILGRKKKLALGGFSAMAALPHTGFVYYCPLVHSAPPALRMKAAGVVANK